MSGGHRLCADRSEAETSNVRDRQDSMKRKKTFKGMSFFFSSSARRDSNPRPRPWQGRAPPTEPLAQTSMKLLHPVFGIRARDGTRTRGPDLGKVVLHQLSHSRICVTCLSDTYGIILRPGIFVNPFLEKSSV